MPQRVLARSCGPNVVATTVFPHGIVTLFGPKGSGLATDTTGSHKACFHFSNDIPIAREEIFGAVVCVIAYDSKEEAISIANDSKYGLHASVIGTDLGRARRVASQLRAGRVVINGMTDDPRRP